MSRAKNTPRGLCKVLFVRVNADLLERLDRMVEIERKEKAGRVVSRADIARQILYAALNKKAKE